MSEFAGEARIEIKPDLTGFLASLNTQLAAMKPNPVIVPVVTAGGQQVTKQMQQTAAATGSAAAAMTNLGTQSQKAATQTTAATRAQTLQATAAKKLALAQSGVVNATTTVAAAQIRLTQSTAAVTAARAAYQATLKTGSFDEIRAARNAIGLAKAYQTEAAAALESASANAARTTSLRTGLRGGAATLLSLLGIRGATLAASGAFLGGAAAVTLFVKSIQSAARLETELATFRATTGALADEMLRVQEAAVRLGADITLPGVTAGDAAIAMSSLARAGLSVENSIAGARGVLQLATAAQIDFASAADLTANALNAFGLSGDQAVRVADDLANAANASQGEIEDMGVALQQVAAVARQVGVGLEDTVSLLTLLAKNGLQGSDAGTSLRTAFLRLVNPTKEAAGFIELLNIQVRDLQGNVRPDVFAQFTEATRALSPAMRDAIIATVFGQDAIRAVAIAGREGADGLRLMQYEIDQQGTAAELAAARTSGLRGAMGALGNQVETAGTQFGETLLPFVTDTVTGFTDLVIATDLAIEKLVELGQAAENLPEDILGKLGLDIDVPQGGLLDILERGTGIGRGDSLLEVLGITGKEDEAIKSLTEELNRLQDARVALEKSVPGAGETLTPEIKRVRAELRALQQPDAIGPSLTPLGKQLEKLRAPLADIRALRKQAFEEGIDTSAYDRAIAEIISATADLKAGIKDELKGVDFSELATNLQAVLRGFRLDPDGEHAQKFLAEAKRLVGQLSKLGPDVGVEGERIGRTLLKSIRDAMRAALAAGDGATVAQLRAYSKRLSEIFEGALAEDFANINITVGFTLSEKSAIEEATGASNATRLARLRRDRQRLQDDIDRLTAVPRSQLSQAQRDKLARKSASINQVDAEIQSIIDEESRAAEQQADAIVKARSEADQKVIDELARGRRRPERLLERAGLSEGLKDDLEFTIALKAVIRQQIKEARTRIKDAETRNRVLADLNERLFQLEKDRRRLNQQIAEQNRRAAEEQRDALRRNLELRIDLASERGNVGGERRARLRFIKFLENQIADLKKQKKLTIEQRNAILELQIEIARQKDALKDLGAEAKGRNDEFRKLTFQFLQMQQGFAANLLGNLIPGFATGGLVGGTSGGPLTSIAGGVAEARRQSGFGSVDGAIARDRAIASKAGPTGGQLSELIAVNRQMLATLARIAGDAKHPEARSSKVTTRAAMDIMPM